jgi:hypothetical protein
MHVTQVPARSDSWTVVVGTPKVLDPLRFGFPATITAVPGASGSLLVEYSTTPGAAGNPGAASWANWPSATVSARTSNTLTGPVTGLRATATTANGVLEVVG